MGLDGESVIDSKRTHGRIVKQKTCETYNSPHGRNHGPDVLPPKSFCMPPVYEPRSRASDGSCMAGNNQPLGENNMSAMMTYEMLRLTYI